MNAMFSGGLPSYLHEPKQCTKTLITSESTLTSEVTISWCFHYTQFTQDGDYHD